MYAVIKTGGKQYRVSPGDLLVVEKLAGEPGDAVTFGEVLLLGDGETVTVGTPIVEGQSVAATLIETRRGEKIKVFKKIRRQGYRRTQGHRQSETVLRITNVAGQRWDGVIDLTPKRVLDARARGFKDAVAAESHPVISTTPGATAARKPKRKAAAPTQAEPEAEA